MATPENDIPHDTGSGVHHLPPSIHSKYIALPLPLSPHTTLHIRITRLETSNMIFLTITDYSASSTTSALGSFVYAMPNVSYPSFSKIAFMASNKYAPTAPESFGCLQHRSLPRPKQYRPRNSSCQNSGSKDLETYVCRVQCYLSGGYG